jgi:hypothetical protein
VIAAADSVSSTKSRSDTASSEFAIGFSKPSAFAVDRERGTGERRRSERRLIQPLARIREPPAIAGSHLDIGEQMVPEGHRLGGLQMGEARHHGRGVLERLVGERALVIGKRRVDGVDRHPDPQPEIGRHLVVAGAGGVQPACRRPDQIGEPALHVHMNVLQRPLELELAALDL